jgi:hypothetical protein
MSDKAMELEFARVRSLVFEPYTLFRVRPMSGHYVNVSEAGYRSNSRDAAWPPDPNAANVFVFGGSTAFGYEVADAETIPAQLADRLQTAVYNFASPNYAAVQERIRLEQLLLDGHPIRAAIFIDGFDEFIAPYYEGVMQQPYVEALRPRRVREKVWDIVRPRRVDENSGQLPDPANVLDRYFANATMIKAVCSSFGVRPLFVWQPVPCYNYEAAAQHLPGHGSAEPLIECVRKGYEMMSERRSALGDDFLWLADLQTGRRENLYVDADHYTPAFSGEIASEIARHVVGRGILR